MNLFDCLQNSFPQIRYNQKNSYGSLKESLFIIYYSQWLKYSDIHYHNNNAEINCWLYMISILPLKRDQNSIFLEIITKRYRFCWGADFVYYGFPPPLDLREWTIINSPRDLDVKQTRTLIRWSIFPKCFEFEKLKNPNCAKQKFREDRRRTGNAKKDFNKFAEILWSRWWSHRESNPSFRRERPAS